MKQILFSFFATLFLVSSVYAQTEYQVDFSQPTIHKTPNIEIRVGPGTQYNSFYGNSWLMHYSGSSFIEFEFDKDYRDSDPAFLEITHLSSLVNGQPYSPISIYVNDQSFLPHHDPHNGNWIHERFDVTGWLKDGTNVIRLELDHDAITNYWIRDVKLTIGE